MIIVDSREKKWEHIRERFEQIGVPYEFPHKLDVGDYYNTENPSVVVDRKADLQEICGNLSKGSGNIVRFVKECKRAKEKHIRLVVLIEGTSAKRPSDLKGWSARYGRFTGQWLAEKMFNLTRSYDVEWEFCRKNESAKRILEIVGWKNEIRNETGLQNNELQDGTDDDHDGGFAS